MSASDQGFVLAEDLAVKAGIQGLNLKVDDANAPVGGRPVQVYFRMPQEEIRAQRFPYITIDLESVERAPEREHRGYTHIPYWPQTYAQSLDPNALPASVDDNTTLMGDYPIPFNLDYSITSWARFNRHSRAIAAGMFTFTHPGGMRSGYVTVPQDGTVRSMDVLSGPVPDDLIDPAGKRLFRNQWAVRVYAELLPETIEELVKANVVVIGLTTDPTDPHWSTSTGETYPTAVDFDVTRLGA